MRLAMSKRDLPTVVRPYLEQLARELNETVDLGVLDGMHVLFIAQHPAPQRSLMVVSQVGARFPAYCTANGKALLAQLPPDEVKRRLPKRLDIPARHTQVNRRDLFAELETVRATGLAFDREEHHAGICGVGVVITDIDGSCGVDLRAHAGRALPRRPGHRHRGAAARARRGPGRPPQRLTREPRARGRPWTSTAPQSSPSSAVPAGAATRRRWSPRSSRSWRTRAPTARPSYSAGSASRRAWRTTPARSSRRARWTTTPPRCSTACTRPTASSSARPCTTRTSRRR